MDINISKEKSYKKWTKVQRCSIGIKLLETSNEVIIDNLTE